MAPRTPLRYPLGYFQRHDRPSLAVGAGVVIAQSLAVVIALWWFVQAALSRIDLPAGASGAGSIADQLFYYFFMSIIGWLLLAALLHVFVWFADGRQGYSTTLAVVGEAELVSIVLFPVVLFALFSAVGEVPRDPQAAMSFLQSTASQQSPLTFFSSLVGTIWKATITGFGLSEAHGIDRGKAFVVTFALGLLAFLMTLGG